MNTEEIESRFNHHPPKDGDTVVAHATARRTLKDAARILNTFVPPGREHALMMTKLEEAMFWANAAIARNN